MKKKMLDFFNNAKVVLTTHCSMVIHVFFFKTCKIKNFLIFMLLILLWNLTILTGLSKVTEQ